MSKEETFLLANAKCQEICIEAVPKLESHHVLTITVRLTTVYTVLKALCFIFFSPHKKHLGAYSDEN